MEKIEITKEEFRRRFVAELSKWRGNFDEREGSFDDYAADAAEGYWGEPDQRADGPEECARSDVSYWET